MIGTITLINATAYGAGLTGISRIDLDQRDTGALRLVGQELLELVKRPVCMSCSLLAPSSRRPLANAGQVLHGDCPIRVLRFLHEMLADRVVHITLETGLLARNLAQLAFGRFRALALQVAAAVRVDTAVALYPVARIALAVRVGGDVDDAQVNTEHIIHLSKRRLLDIASDGQVELAAMIDQVALALLGKQEFSLPLAAGE